MCFVFLCDIINTICSNDTLDKILNIVYNRLTRRSPTPKRRGMVFLTATGR